MIFQDAASFADKARSIDRQTFATQYPRPAVLIEPAGTLDGGTIASGARITWWGDAKALRIGRDVTWATLVLAHAKISRQHAVLSCRDPEAGKGAIVDRGSTHGTTVRGERLATATAVSVDSGERIVLAGLVSLRTFWRPGDLHELLARPEHGAAEPPPRHEQLERLASSFRSLGFDVTVAARALRIDMGEESVRVARGVSLFVIEWGRGGVYLQRKSLDAFAPDAEDRVRAMVLTALSLSDPTFSGHFAETQPDD